MLLLLCAALEAAVYHVLVVVLKREEQAHVRVLGYSGVLFGWMAALALDRRGPAMQFSLLGMAQLPGWLVPIFALGFTSLVVPSASFWGHLCGVGAGALVALGLFDWAGAWYCWLGLCLAAGALVLWGLRREGRLAAGGGGFSYIRLPGFDVESWGGGGGAAAAAAPGSGGGGGGNVTIRSGVVVRS